MISKKSNTQDKVGWQGTGEGEDEGQSSLQSLAGKQHVTDL